MTLIQLAQQMSVAFETAKRPDGAQFVRLNDDRRADWMTDVIRAAHDGGDILPLDDIYAEVRDAVDALGELYDDADDDDITDRIHEVEADSYYNKLTGWLHADPGNRLALLNEQEHRLPHMSGAEMLMSAQEEWKRNIWRAVHSALYTEFIENHEEE